MRHDGSRSPVQGIFVFRRTRGYKPSRESDRQPGIAIELAAMIQQLWHEDFVLAMPLTSW